MIGVALSIVFIIISVYLVALSAIATQCYNENPGFTKEHSSNDKFLNGNIIVVVLMLMGSIMSLFGCIYFRV